MAKKTIITVVDDVDGKELGEDFMTVKFSIGSKDYEFDTSEKNAAKFYDQLDKWVQVARKPEKVAKNGRAYRKTNLDVQNLKMVREWANGNGYTVSDRGRIPQEIQDAYEATH